MSIKIDTFALPGCALALLFGMAGAVQAAGSRAASIDDAWHRWLPNKLPAAALHVQPKLSDGETPDTALVVESPAQTR